MVVQCIVRIALSNDSWLRPRTTIDASHDNIYNELSYYQVGERLYINKQSWLEHISKDIYIWWNCIGLNANLVIYRYQQDSLQNRLQMCIPLL